jgi:hypothetical protein
MHQVIDCPVRLTSTNRAELRDLYADLRDHYLRKDAEHGTRTTIHFIWQDATSLDPEHFWATFADQRHTFDPLQPIMNSIRTDASGLDDERRHLLRHGFNSVIGVCR